MVVQPFARSRMCAHAIASTFYLTSWPEMIFYAAADSLLVES